MITSAFRFNYVWNLKYENFHIKDGCRGYPHHLVLFAPEGGILSRSWARVEDDTKVFVRLLNENNITGWVRWEDDGHPIFSFIEKSNAMRMKLIFSSTK